MDLPEEAQRGAQFDDLYFEANALWAALATSQTIKPFKTIRDIVSAQMGRRQSNYRANATARGVIGMLIRNAGFAWDSLDEQLKLASEGFWDVYDVRS